MKTLFLTLLSALLLSCSTDSQNESETLTQRTTTNVNPVYDQNGLFSAVRGKTYINIQWYTDYDFPTFQPYYNTITMNGVVVTENYYESLNRFSIQVSKTTKSATFTISQTIIGVGTSEAVTLIVTK